MTMSLWKSGLTESVVQALLCADDDSCDSGSDDSNCNDTECPDYGVGQSSLQRDSINIPPQFQHAPFFNLNSQTHDRRYSWRSIINNEDITAPRFTDRSGPCHDLPAGSTPLNYLSLFLTDSIVETLVNNTNTYAELCQDENNKKDLVWKNITLPEFWRFISVILVMSIVRMPNLSDYWSQNPILGNCFVKQSVAKNRFFKIMQYFHISDRKVEKKPFEQGYSYLQKTEPLMSELRKNFQKHFLPDQRLSIHEVMIKYKGRLGIVQYTPTKPIKKGIKIWTMCSATTGYTLNFHAYCGKRDSILRTKQGLGYDVIMYLIKILKHRNHIIFFDDFFSSVPLMHDLLHKGIYACCTVFNDAKFLPEVLKSIKLVVKGSSVVFQCVEMPNLLCTTWMDSKQAYVLSTGIKGEIREVQRNTRNKRTLVKCPLPFIEYNRHLKDIERVDLNSQHYSSARKSKKWWMYIFRYLLDAAVNNAFVLYTLTNIPKPKAFKTFPEFRFELIDEINQKYKNKRAAPPKSEEEHPHKRVRIEGRKRTCVKCRKKGTKTVSGRSVESPWKCGICGICFCISCFD